MSILHVNIRTKTYRQAQLDKAGCLAKFRRVFKQGSHGEAQAIDGGEKQE